MTWKLHGNENEREMYAKENGKQMEPEAGRKAQVERWGLIVIRDRA
jgi:hypothetical protein